MRLLGVRGRIRVEDHPGALPGLLQHFADGTALPGFDPHRAHALRVGLAHAVAVGVVGFRHEAFAPGVHPRCRHREVEGAFGTVDTEYGVVTEHRGARGIQGDFAAVIGHPLGRERGHARAARTDDAFKGRVEALDAVGIEPRIARGEHHGLRVDAIDLLRVAHFDRFDLVLRRGHVRGARLKAHVHTRTAHDVGEGRSHGGRTRRGVVARVAAPVARGGVARAGHRVVEEPVLAPGREHRAARRVFGHHAPAFFHEGRHGGARSVHDAGGQILIEHLRDFGRLHRKGRFDDGLPVDRVTGAVVQGRARVARHIAAAHREVPAQVALRFKEYHLEVVRLFGAQRPVGLGGKRRQHARGAAPDDDHVRIDRFTARLFNLRRSLAPSRKVRTRLIERIGDRTRDTATRERRPRHRIDRQRLLRRDGTHDFANGRVAQIGRVARLHVEHFDRAVRRNAHARFDVALAAARAAEVFAGLQGPGGLGFEEPRRAHRFFGGRLHGLTRHGCARDAVDLKGLRCGNALCNLRTGLQTVARRFTGGVDLDARELSRFNADRDFERTAHALRRRAIDAVRGSGVRSSAHNGQSREHRENQRFLQAFHDCFSGGQHDPECFARECVARTFSVGSWKSLGTPARKSQ